MSEGRDRLAALMANRGNKRAVERKTQRPSGPISRPECVAFFERQPGARVVVTNGWPAVLVPGDCRHILPDAPQSSVDTIIADPGVGDPRFETDRNPHPVPDRTFWTRLLHVARPGAHMAVFAGRRYSHRLDVYVEDAGWEKRDTIAWFFLKGMPMSLDIGQAVDRKMGGEGAPYFRTIGSMTDEQRAAFLERQTGNPWWGWGTELRPSWEPISIFRKPLAEGSVADNAIRWGVGPMNIDATRIPVEERDAIATHIPEGQGSAHGLALQKNQAVVGKTSLGRWPADAIWMHPPECDETGCVEGCPVGQLDAQDPDRREPLSRFFYTPKASRGERDIGLATKNPHKACKPLAVNEWLISLLNPPTGIVLDPFCGTGSTGMAAARLSCPFVGIDTNPAWLDIAERRIPASIDLE